MPRTTVLESLLVSNHRLTRIAAQATGDTTSSAVWSTLSVLITDGPKRTGELARAARISQPGMTKILQNLVEDEWVYRIADVEDSRAWLIAITEKGRSALSDWRVRLAGALSPIFSDLTPAEWATLEAASHVLETHVGAAAVAAA